jgi:hypothetical protein
MPAASCSRLGAYQIGSTQRMLLIRVAGEIVFPFPPHLSLNCRALLGLPNNVRHRRAPSARTLS